MFIAVSFMSAMASCATSRGVGPLPELGGGSHQPHQDEQVSLRLVAGVDRAVVEIRALPNGSPDLAAGQQRDVAVIAIRPVAVLGIARHRSRRRVVTP